MTDLINVDGKCYCGDISIKGTVASAMVMACHCTDCQKFSGAPFRAVAFMPAENIEITGSVKEYLKTADSGNERLQGFCGNCGSQIYATDPAKTTFMVRTGCLTQFSSLIPVKHIFGSSMAEWLSSIGQKTWVSTGPTSAEITPPTK
tara:strand:- start:317 stop:757 length:441 start_codon:yes stop_codon:yes gene_type:complete